MYSDFLHLYIFISTQCKKKYINNYHAAIAMKNKKKACESEFPYSFLIDFAKSFPWERILLDFGFLTEEAS